MSDRVQDVIAFLSGQGIFFWRLTDTDIPEDKTHEIYNKDGVTIDICNEYAYVLIMGLGREEWNELMKIRTKWSC